MLQNKFYTVSQAADKVGVTVGYIRRLLRESLIIGEKVGERAWMIPAWQVDVLAKGSLTGKAGRPRSKKNSKGC